MAIINGVGRVGVRVTSGGGTPAPSYLLDTYTGASSAFSLRKLSSTYTGNCIRVRRSSDNAEMNIGFVGESLDTTTLTTFVGAGNGFVTTWYDQSGLGRDAIQTSASNQPKIVINGVLNTLNGKPAIRFDQNQFNYLYVNSTSELNIQDCISTFSVANFVNDGGYFGHIMSKGYGSQGSYCLGQYGRGIDYLQLWIETDQPIFMSITTNKNQQYLFSNTNATGSNGIKLYQNGTLYGQYTTSNDLTGTNSYQFNIGRNNRENSYFLDGNIQEIVCYPTYQQSNLSNINGNINTYYSIYPSDSDAYAFVSAAGITDSTQMGAVNTLVTGLKSAGIWSKMKALYPFVGGNATAHSKNLVNPSLYNLSFSSGWNHTNTGALPNGTNGYIDTNLSPSQTTYTDFSYGDYIRTNSDGVYAEFGISNGNVYIYPRLGNTSYTRYASSENSSPSTDSRGFEVLTQKSGILNYYRNTTQLVNVSNSPSDLSVNTNNYFLSARNVSGTAAQFSNREKSFAFFSSGLLSSEVTTLYNLVQAFQTTLGRQV